MDDETRPEGGVGRVASSSRVAPRGGKGKARVDDKTIHKATRVARKVTPGGGEASGRARPEQAACCSEGQGGAAGGHASQPPALPAADVAGKHKAVVRAQDDQALARELDARSQEYAASPLPQLKQNDLDGKEQLKVVMSAPARHSCCSISQQ